MVGQRFYNFLYRFMEFSSAPRKELVEFIESGEISSEDYPKAIDLGCGTGVNTIYLGEQGFQAHGVDFSDIALKKANQKLHSNSKQLDITFIKGNLLQESIEGTNPPYDLIVDYGTFDDLNKANKQKMSTLIKNISKSGTYFFMWCFFSRKEDLPRFSVRGPSKKFPPIVPGEVESYFGDQFDIRPQHEIKPKAKYASFIMKKR